MTPRCLLPWATPAILLPALAAVALLVSWEAHRGWEV